MSQVTKELNELDNNDELSVVAVFDDVVGKGLS